MPPAYVDTITKSPYDNVRSYPDAITRESWIKGFQKVPQFNFPRPLQLSSKAVEALGAHNVGRFAELVSLKDGWHLGQGKSLQAASLRSIELFLAQYSSFPERCSLFLSEQGNLELVWRSEKNETTSLEFYADRIEYYIETLDEEGEVATRDIATLVQKLAHA